MHCSRFRSQVAEESREEREGESPRSHVGISKSERLPLAFMFHVNVHLAFSRIAIALCLFSMILLPSH